MNNYDCEDLPKKEIEVCISITLSKTVKVKVDDYSVEEVVNEDNRVQLDYDFSKCDLKEAVKEQIILPNEAHFYITANTQANKQAYKDLSGWNVDDFEVVLDND